MPTRYTEVDANQFEQFLVSKGFARTIVGDELVFVRSHDKDKRLLIKVYSSIRVGASSARDCGKDAIRICAVFDDGKKTRGIKRQPRTYRTGGQSAIEARVLERAKAAYAACNEWMKKPW